MDQALRLVEGLVRLWADVLNEALLVKDVGRIASCARIMSRGYRDAMEWAVNLRRAHVPEDWRPVVREMSLFTRDVIDQLEKSPETTRRRLASTDVDRASSEGTVYVDINFKFTLSNVEGFNNAMAELNRRRTS